MKAVVKIRRANNPNATDASKLEPLLLRFTTRSDAVNAVLRTAFALSRPPDAITARDVEPFTPAI